VVGYRRWGHNEGDEPAFTQPLMYQTIKKHPTVRKLLADRLVDEGVVSNDDVAAMEKRIQDRLTKIRHGVTEGTDTYEEEMPAEAGPREEVETALAPDRLRELQNAVHTLPEGFNPNSKLRRQWSQRAQVLDTEGGKVDWAHGETLAFAAILQDGTPIRLSGQDTQRGTFSQRHDVLHDAKTGEIYTPLEHV